MVDLVSASEFDAETEFADWRFLLGRIEAVFVAGSFAQATAFVARVAEAADAANHHPDVDLRYPGRVHVALTTHAVDGLTTADTDLAGTISSLAASAGLAAEPVSARLEVAIDALDIDAVRPFWKAVLDYEEWPPSVRSGERRSVEAKPQRGASEFISAEAASSEGERASPSVTVLVDPRRIGPAFWFQQMDAQRPQRNRIHLDVTVPHDVAEERVAAAVAAGGRVVSDDRARAFWVLADPEGNEACICTWQGRD
jgi:4a-hydroxytetrahydrobiopterin dehydratase